MPDDRPLADASREKFALGLRKEGLPPEEWAARYGHTVGASSLDQYRYATPGLDEWIQRVHVVLRSPSLLGRCRDMFLTAEERARIAKETGEGL